MEVDVLSEKVKKLKHVKVYNRLYSMIQDGVYPPGSQLPSEPELALQMDVSRIDGMDPDRDLETALENNYTLKINKRKLENARSKTTRESLETKIRNNEKQIGASLSSAYKNVLSARLSYEQAVAEAQLEETNTNIAAGKLQAGMMTSLEYKEQEYKMESSRLNAEMAAVSLFQAMETYDWSVKGLASAE